MTRPGSHDRTMKRCLTTTFVVGNGGRPCALLATLQSHCNTIVLLPPLFCPLFDFETSLMKIRDKSWHSFRFCFDIFSHNRVMSCLRWSNHKSGLIDDFCRI